MAFTWSTSIAVDTEILNAAIDEIEGNLGTLKSSILDKNPTVSKVSTPSLDASAQGVKIIDDVYSDLQDYLDQIKSENYCRGYITSYHSALHTTYNNGENSSHNSSVNSSLYSSLCSDQHSSIYGGNYNTNNGGYYTGTNNGRHVTYHDTYNN